MKKTALIALFIALCNYSFSQKASNTTKLIDKNVKVSKGELKLTKYSAIDLSKYSKKEVDTKKVDSLKEIPDIAAGQKTVPFDCQNPEGTKPLLLKALNQIDSRYFNVTSNTDVNLSLFGISGTLGKHDILIQANFWLYKDYPCLNGKADRALIGMTMYLHISSTDIKLPSFSLANVSAAVQLNKATASYNLRFYGVTEGINFNDLPSIGDLTVDNYAKILGAWDKLQHSFKTDMVVDPVMVYNIIPIPPPTD